LSTTGPATIQGPRRAEQRAERRGAILDATVRILGCKGLGAVTHRAVAREAGVPLAATTYYFSSKDELITEAVDLLVAEEVAQLAERAAALGDDVGSPDRAAAALVAVLVPDRAGVGAQLAKFELYLEAARRPALRPIVAKWQEAFIGLAEMALASAGISDPAHRASLLVPAVDGVLMYELSGAGSEPSPTDTEAGRERLRERLQAVFEVVVGDARK
jgi:TetR/AcrR family transcriptional regulator, regulator of biofilm formation and stress response